jgi:sugar transferase (PEP-CTERM system associated)
VFDIIRRPIFGATLIRLGADLSWLFLAVIMAMRMDGHLTSPLATIAKPAIGFALLIVCVNAVLGLYRNGVNLPLGKHVSWMFLALLIGVPIAYLAARLLPGGDSLQDTLGLIALFAFSGLIVLRQAVVEPLLEKLFVHRVLVLGTGPEARVVESSIDLANTPRFRLAGFYPLDKVTEMQVSPKHVLSRTGSIEDAVKRLDIDEIIVAVRQQRGGVLPLRGLLECRLNGVQITDLPRFFERVHGRVPIESLKASWLIYGSGFRQKWPRRVIKRMFDVVASSLLLVVALPLMAIVAILISLESGGPVIYRQERVGLRGVPFTVFKFRSMHKDAEQDGTPRWAAAQDARVTTLGRFLRRSRIDELPQLINVLKGEMSFVGPRPERPTFVAMLTEQVPFYAVRQSVKPGITGWAQVRYSYGATIEQSVKKLEYDLYYVKNNSLLLDLLILIETVRVVLFGEGAR